VAEAPRHPEVDQENATALEPDNQILAAAGDRCDALACELRRHLGRLVGPDEPRIGNLDVLERPPDEGGLELATDALDLGQLRHGAQRSRAASAREERMFR